MMTAQTPCLKTTFVRILLLIFVFVTTCSVAAPAPALNKEPEPMRSSAVPNLAIPQLERSLSFGELAHEPHLDDAPAPPQAHVEDAHEFTFANPQAHTDHTPAPQEHVDEPRSFTFADPRAQHEDTHSFTFAALQGHAEDEFSFPTTRQRHGVSLPAYTSFSSLRPRPSLSEPPPPATLSDFHASDALQNSRYHYNRIAQFRERFRSALNPRPHAPSTSHSPPTQALPSPHFLNEEHASRLDRISTDRAAGIVDKGLLTPFGTRWNYIEHGPYPANRLAKWEAEGRWDEEGVERLRQEVANAEDALDRQSFMEAEGKGRGRKVYTDNNDLLSVSLRYFEGKLRRWDGALEEGVRGVRL